MAAAATEADIPPLLTEIKNEGDQNIVDEVTIDSISKLAQIHANEPLTFEGDNFLITPSVCGVQKPDQAAVDDPGVLATDLNPGNGQTLGLVSDKECNKIEDQSVKVNRGHVETEEVTKEEYPSNQTETTSEQVQEDKETTENASDNSREDKVMDDDGYSKEIEKSTRELQLTQVVDGSHTECDQQLEKENDVSTDSEYLSHISDIRDENDNLKKVEPFETEKNLSTEEEVRVEKSIESLHAAPNSWHDNKATSSSEEQIMGAEKIVDHYKPKELQQDVEVSATNEGNDNSLLSQVGAHLEQEEISTDKTEEETEDVAGTKEEYCTENVATFVNPDSSIAEDGSPRPSEKQVSTFKDRDRDSAHALEDRFEDGNSQKAELVETEKCTEKILTEASGEKEVPTKDAHEISTDVTKKEINEVAATEAVITASIQKEVTTSKPIDHEQPANMIEDESTLKAESVEKQNCTEKEMEISSSEALTEEAIQTTKSDATKDEITEVADIRTENVKAEIEDESSLTTDFIENEKCVDKEIEVPSMDASSEKEIPTANLQEITSEPTEEEGDEVPNSVEEDIKDVAMNIPNPENRETPQVAEDETKFSACKVTEDEAVNTVEAKFEIESTLKAEVFENKECTGKTTDIVTDEGPSKKDIQAVDSHELLSDKTKEEIDEDITSNFPNQENEEVSNSQTRETEQPTNTLEDESSLKVKLVEKENCTENDMEISSREVSSEKEIESIVSEKTKEVITEVADMGGTKDIETSILDQENKDTSAVEEDRSENTEKAVSSCEANADHEPTNSFEAKIEDKKPTKEELVENEKCIEGEISSTEGFTERDIPTANPKEISTNATKEECGEVVSLMRECIKDVATDDANKENEDTSQGDASQKPSHKEVPTSGASDHDSENTLDAKFVDKNSLKTEFVENEECTEKEMEVSTEPSSEKEIPTANLQEVSSATTEEEIYEAEETKDITTHVLDQKNEETSLAAEDHLQKPSQNEISTSKDTDQETTNTLEGESSLKAELVEKEICPEKEMETSSTELSSEKEIQTTETDKTREEVTKVADIKEDGTEAKIEEESSQKAEIVENEKCIDKEMEISSAASTEKEIKTEHLQEISSGTTEEASDRTANPKEESIKGEAINILNQENEDTSPIAKDGSTNSVSEKAGNTLEVKFEDEGSLKEEILPKDDSSEEALTIDSLEISSEKLKEQTGKVADTKEESTETQEDLSAEARSQEPSQKEVLTSNVHNLEPTNTHDAQLDNEISLNAECIEDKKCTKEEMDKPSIETSSEKQIETADPQDDLSDKTKEEIDGVADLKEESIKDVAVTAPNQENDGTLPTAEERAERSCLEEVSICKFNDNVVGHAVRDKFQDESSIKPELVENEKTTEKPLVEEEQPTDSVHPADNEIKVLDSRPNKERSFLEEEKAIEHNTEDKAHNATTEMVETCDNEDVETDIPHENAKEKPEIQVHSSCVETETLTRETAATISVTEEAQADINEEKSTEANAEGDKGIISSEKDNDQILASEDDSQQPSPKESSAGNTDDDKSTVVQDDKYAEANKTEHALSRDEKDVEGTLEEEELSIESLQVSKDFEGIGTVKSETETSHLEEQSVATTLGIISELEEVKTINTTALNAETPDVDIEGQEMDKTMYATDPKAEAPDEKDVAPTVTHADTEERFSNEVKALETSKEPEPKSVEDQIISSNLQEIPIVKMMKDNSDITSMNKETLDKQEVKLEDREAITAEYNERSVEILVMKEPTESLQVAVKNDVECVSGLDSENSRALQEANHEKITYDSKDDEKTKKMEPTIETPGSENIAAIDDEKSPTVLGSKYVEEHDLNTLEKDTECTSGKEEVSIESLQVASEDIKAVGSVKETSEGPLIEQDIVTNTEGIISVLEKDKIMGASDRNAEKSENKDVATMVTHKDAEENLPTESDAKQYTDLEKVTENSSDVEIQTQHTTESTLAKEESQLEDIELSTPCKEPEAKSSEEKIVTSDLQENPISKTEEEASDTISITREALDEQEIKYEDKDTITAKFNESSTDVALATEDSQIEDIKLSAPCQEAEVKSAEEQIVTSNLQEIPTAKVEEETSVTKSMTREAPDERETKFEDKDTAASEFNETSTDEALAVKEESVESLQVSVKDVETYDAGQESEISSSLQEEIPEANNEKFIYDVKEGEEIEKMESTTKTLDTKDVTTIPQEDTCETSISQMDLSQKEHESPSFTELPKEDTAILKEEEKVQCIDSLQDKEASPVKDQILDTDSLNISCTTTDEKIIVDETHTLQEGLEVKDNTMEETDFKVSEVADDTSKKCEEQLEEDDTLKGLLEDETNAEYGTAKTECKQEKILSEETKDVQESTATATPVAHDSSVGMESTIDEKQQNEEEDEGTENRHLGSCKKEITMEKQVQEATQENRENIDNENEAEKIPKDFEGDSGENAREPQEDLPANESWDRSLHQKQEEKNIEEVIDTEDINQADNSYAEIRTRDITKNEEENMGEICESKKHVDITGKVSKAMDETVEEPEEHSLAKEPIDESREQEKLGNNVTQVASTLVAENIHGTDNLQTKTNQEEISEAKEITNETEKESKVSEKAVQVSEEILLANADNSLNQEGVASSTEETATIVHAERSHGEETKTEDLGEQTIIESSPQHDVKPKEIIMEEVCELKENEKAATIVHAERSYGEEDTQNQETKTEDPREEVIKESSPKHDIKPKEIIKEEIFEVKENEKAATIVHTERSYGEEDARHQENKSEDSREEAIIESSTDHDAKPKEILMEEIFEVNENEKTATVVHAERSYGEEDAQHQENKTEDSREEPIIESSPEHDVKPKEMTMGETCVVEENEKAETIVYAESSYGEEDVQHQETKTEDSREESIIESSPEHDVKPKEMVMEETCEVKENEKAATIVHAARSKGEEDAQHQVTKTEDSRDDQPIIESPPKQDVKPKEIIMEEIGEVKENENETEKVFNVFEATVEDAKDKTIEEATTTADTEEIHQVKHVNIERKFEDSREVKENDEVMQEEIKTGEICSAKELGIETEKEPKVSEEITQDPEEDIETYESIDKSAVQIELEKSIEEHVKVEDAHRIDPVHTEANIEKPVKTEGCTEYDIKQQETIEKEICEVQKTADETMKGPKTIEEDAIQEPEEEIKMDKSSDRSPYEVNQQEINEKDISDVKTFPDEASKVATQGLAETAVEESEENIHTNVTESLQQKEPRKCVEQVSEVSPEDSEQKAQELEEKFPTNITRSISQNESNVSAEEVATILDTKEVCHRSVDVHTEARGVDLGEKGETENHPAQSETKGVSSDFEKVDDKAVQALEETQKEIGVVTTSLDASETGFEESKEENNLETAPEKDWEHLGKETKVATATLDTEKLNKNVARDPVPTQTVYTAIEQAEDKKENSDAIKEETCQKPDQKDNTCSSNESKVKEEESPQVTETKGEDDDKNTFKNKEDESANTPKPKDTEKPSLSALFQSSTREMVLMADDPVTSRECAVQRDSQPLAEQIDDDPAKSREEKVSDEESNEKRSSDIVAYEAPVMVDAAAVADTEVKTAHKKSHNILSGVGSKVKHSISKVKKAITGKSSHHPKPSSPN